MKGLTHLTVGVAAASCFPEAVRAAADGDPTYFILGAVFGLLPDTLDFKFRRFLVRHDMEITPDPSAPDPDNIASALAGAVGTALMEEKPYFVKLNTTALGADSWQQYRVKFETGRGRVTAEIGPAVTTGQIPLGNPTTPRRASAALPCPVSVDYQSETTVDIFDGPTFRLVPRDGTVRVEFIPWHREWTHSIVLAAAAGAIGAAVMGWTAGAVIFAAATMHALADQLGFMGSSLWFPISKKRRHGLGLMKSTSEFWNLSTIWVACCIIFWNLYRAAVGAVPQMNAMQILVYGAALPLGLIALVDRLLSRYDLPARHQGE